MVERRLRVVRDDELPHSIGEYLRRTKTIDLESQLGGQALWLWAADAYGIVTAGTDEADVVHCDSGAYVPVEYVEMRRLAKVEEVNDWTQGVDEVNVPEHTVAVFRVRDEVLEYTDWIEQSPDGVADYAEVGVAIDAPVTIVDDDEYQDLIRPSFQRRPKLTVVT